MRIKRRRYTPSDVRKIHDLLKKGKSFEEIAKAVGRTAHAIQIFISRMGWSHDGIKTKRRAYTETEDNLIWSWRDAGHKNKVIARGLARSYGAVRQRVSLIGV